jgi:hypothetical protein
VADGTPTKEEEIAKVLLQEYVSTRKEVLLHVQLYKTQYRNIGIVTAIAGLLVPLVIGHIPIPGISSPYQVTGWVAFLIVFTILSAAIMITFSVLAALFAMQVLGVRCERLEIQINECLGGQYLIWEHVTVPLVWGPSGPVFKNPDAGVMVLFYVFLILFVLGLPGVVITKILCSAPDKYLWLAAVFCIWYSWAFGMYAGYVNVYTMGGGLRRDVREMHQPARPSEPKQYGRAGLGFVLIIGGVAVFITWGLVTIAKQPGVCDYVGRFL